MAWWHVASPIFVVRLTIEMKYLHNDIYEMQERLNSIILRHINKEILDKVNLSVTKI